MTDSMLNHLLPKGEPSQWPWQSRLQARIIYSYGALFLFVLALLITRIGWRIYDAQVAQSEHKLEVDAFIAANAFEDPRSNYATDFAIIESWNYRCRNDEDFASSEKRRKVEWESESQTLLTQNLLFSEQTLSMRLQQSAENLAERSKVRVTILTAQGNVIADSADASLATPNQLQQPEIQAALEGIDHHDVRVHYDGEEMLFAAAPIRRYRTIVGIVQLSQPMYDVLTPARQLLFELIVTGILAMFLVTVVGIWNGRWLLRPVEALKKVAIAITEGDLQQQAPISGNDEIGALAHAFNQSDLARCSITPYPLS